MRAYFEPGKEASLGVFSSSEDAFSSSEDALKRRLRAESEGARTRGGGRATTAAKLVDTTAKKMSKADRSSLRAHAQRLADESQPVVGVHYRNRDSKWRVRVTFGTAAGNIQIGTFANKVDAIERRLLAGRAGVSKGVAVPTFENDNTPEDDSDGGEHSEDEADTEVDDDDAAKQLDARVDGCGPCAQEAARGRVGAVKDAAARASIDTCLRSVKHRAAAGLGDVETRGHAEARQARRRSAQAGQ